MMQIVVLVVLLGATCFGHGIPDGIRRKSQEETKYSTINKIHTEHPAITKNHSSPLHHILTYNETNENFAKLVELFVLLSEAEFRDNDILPRSRRGIWEDAVNKMKETYNNVAGKVKESATKVKDKFHKTFVDSGFKDKVKEFFQHIANEFQVDKMCRNVQKLNNILRRYPIDDKISTLMSFLNIVLCELSKDSDAGFHELMENPKYERMISEKDANLDFEKLMRYISELKDDDDPDSIADLLKNSSDLHTSKTTMIFLLGSVLAVVNIVKN